MELPRAAVIKLSEGADQDAGLHRVLGIKSGPDPDRNAVGVWGGAAGRTRHTPPGREAEDSRVREVGSGAGFGSQEGRTGDDEGRPNKKARLRILTDARQTAVGRRDGGLDSSPRRGAGPRLSPDKEIMKHRASG